MADFGGTIRLNGADEYKRNLRTINSELRLVSREMEVNGRSFENTQRQIDLYNRKIEEQRRWIETVRQALEAETNSAERNEERIARLQRELNNANASLLGMEQGLRNAQAGLEELANAEQRAAEAAREAAEAERRAAEEAQTAPFNRLGDTLTDLGSKAAAFSAALAGVAAASGKAAMDFETSFAKVSTLINDSSIDMAALAEDTKKLSSSIGVSQGELNEAFYQALSAGVEISADYGKTLDFLEQNTKVAKAGFTDLQTAIDTTTTILNAYGLELDETSRIHETLVNTQNLGKTTVAELGTSLSQVVPTAASLGIEIEQVGAAFAAMTAQGVPTAQAATQLRSAFAELSKEGQQAYDNFEKLSGQSFKEFIENGGTLSEAMKILADGAKTAGVEVNSMFGSIEASNAALILSGTGFDKFNESLEQMVGSAGVVDEAFNKVTDTAQAKLAKSMNELANAGTELGASLTPIVESFSGKVSEFAQWFSALDESTKQSIASFVLFGAALSPVLLTVGKMSKGIAELIPTVNKLKEALMAMSATEIGLLAVAAALLALNAAVESGIRDIDEANAVMNDFNDTLAEQQKAYNDSLKAIDDKAQAQKDELEVMRNLLPRLEELNSKTDRTAAENEELNGIIKELNKAFPDLQLEIDATTGSINKQVTAIEDLIAAQEREIEVSARRERVNAAQRNKMSAEDTVSTAKNALESEYRNLSPDARVALSGVKQDAENSKYWTSDQIWAYLNEYAKSRPTVDFDYASEISSINKYIQALQNAQVAESRLTSATGTLNKETEKFRELLGGNLSSKTDAGGTTRNTARGSIANTSKVSEVSKLDDKVKNGLDVWEYRYKAGIISTEEYIKELTRIRDEYFAKDSKAWRDQNLKIIELQKKVDNDKTNAAKQAAKDRETAEKEALKAKEAAEKQAEKERAEAEKQAEKDKAEALKQAKKEYDKEQANSYDWIAERVYRGDFGEYGTDAKESYERIYARALSAYKASVLTEDELAAEVDKINAAKLKDYQTEKKKAQNFIADRDFYNDWQEFNTNEEQVLRQMLNNAQKYYDDGILGYEQYLEDVRELNKSIYKAQASEQKAILEAAQNDIDMRLNEKKAEINRVKSELNAQVSELRASYTTQDRRKRLGELEEEINDFRNAVTIEGQKHLKSLEEERERLLREEEIENLQKKNNEIIEQLEAEYAQLETEKTSLLASMEDSVASFADNTAAQLKEITAAIAGMGDIVSGTMAATQNNVSNIQNNYNNSTTANQYITANGGENFMDKIERWFRKIKG